ARDVIGVRAPPRGRGPDAARAPDRAGPSRTGRARRAEDPAAAAPATEQIADRDVLAARADPGAGDRAAPAHAGTAAVRARADVRAAARVRAAPGPRVRGSP